MWGATNRIPININQVVQFQSTLPVWGATEPLQRSCIAVRISIHAPRVGSDNASSTVRLLAFPFQSTLPVWGATGYLVPVEDDLIISIHAPRVGSDLSLVSLSTGSWYFNPRSPCGERRVAAVIHGNDSHFNPRSPCGERQSPPCC